MTTKFLVGKPFKSPLGRHVTGELAPKEAATWRSLDSLISAGFLYPYVPEAGYNRLPPHLYNAVRTKQEVEGLIARGQEPVVSEWSQPEAVTQAIELREAEAAHREEQRALAEGRAEEWTQKIQDAQISPNPINLPKEDMYVDSKHDEAEAAADTEGKDYSKMNKQALVAEIEARNNDRAAEDEISTSGTKSELYARIVEDDLRGSAPEKEQHVPPVISTDPETGEAKESPSVPKQDTDDESPHEQTEVAPEQPEAATEEDPDPVHAGVITPERSDASFQDDEPVIPQVEDDTEVNHETPVDEESSEAPFDTEEKQV